jgi:hypothetical protein
MTAATALCVVGATNLSFGQPRYREPVRESALWVSRDSVARVAHSLSNRAGDLHRSVERRAYFSHLAADVHRFSDMAERFHQIVEGRTSYPRVLREFERLQDEYYRMRSSLYQAHQANHSLQVRRDWYDVVTAFEALALTVGSEGMPPCRPFNGRYSH